MILKPFYDRATDTYTGNQAKTREIVRKTEKYLSPLMKLIDADNKTHSKEYNIKLKLCILLLVDKEHQNVYTLCRT